MSRITASTALHDNKLLAAICFFYGGRCLLWHLVVMHYNAHGTM